MAPLAEVQEVQEVQDSSHNKVEEYLDCYHNRDLVASLDCSKHPVNRASHRTSPRTNLRAQAKEEPLAKKVRDQENQEEGRKKTDLPQMDQKNQKVERLKKVGDQQEEED